MANASAAGRLALATAVLCATIASFLVYWTLFPALTAGAIGNDALFLADGARRIASGQIPHVDFSVPTGAEPYFAYHWAERLLPQVSPYIGSHLIGFALLAPLLLAAASQFQSRLAALALIALVAVAALLPFNELSTTFYGLSFHGAYNRLGSAFALAYLAWIFRAQDKPSWANGLLIAYALLFAAFLKIVFVAVVLAPLLVLAVFDGRWCRAGFLAAVVAGATLVVVEAGAGLVGGYLDDIRAMSAVNGGRAAYLAASFAFRNLVELALVAAALALFAAGRVGAALDQRGALIERLRPLAQPAAMVASLGALVVAESQATGGLEATSALGLLFAPAFIDRPRTNPRCAIVAAAAFGLLGGALAVNVVENAGGILLARKGQAVAEPWAIRFMPQIVVPETMARQAETLERLWTQTDAMRGLGPRQDEILTNFRLTQYLAMWRTVDAALARLGRTDDLGAVATLSGVDLFGLALRARPVEGLKVVHDVGRTIGTLTPEQARAYVARADTLFEPTCKLVEAPVVSIAPWFAGVLAEEFTARALTPCWTVHRRKTG